MSYYQGDFYQGDPGFFSGLGKLFKGAASGLAGMIPVVGPAVSAVMKSRLGQTVMKHPTLSAAGTAGTIGALGGAAAGRRLTRMGAAQVGPAGMGMHPAMRAARAGRIPGMRHHRRMRVTNVKALRRAIRRARGFEKLARKVMHFVSPRHPKGRAVFRTRKRKSI